MFHRVIAIAALIFSFVCLALAQQQRTERGTQQWRIALDRVTGYGADVQIIDTSGVCLYVAFTAMDGLAARIVAGIAAVPKTQLPQGSGCQ